MIVAITGSFMGSFMLWLTYHQDSLFRRSSCESCQNNLTWFQLIPIVSFLLQRGRCSYCGSIIPLYLFLTELLFASLFLSLCAVNQAMVLIATLISFLVPLAVYDIHHLKVPNHMLILMGGLLLLIQYPLLFDLSHLLASVLLIVLLHLFYLLTHSIGYGDVKLLSLFALFLPLYYFLLIFMLTYFIGGIAVIFFLFYKRNLHKIPLVPFIAVSTFLVIKFYAELYTIYFGGFI
ncbi:prepilin peptidase [Macrococcus hajekii]|uniref:Prepilin peptidase n=1 Tax=Macrococcus hajekii TaxID=198482 RepID=A0A4R6BMC2_9STAP|nr:prepilin peptidase [Macrococcus hajekii]TDM02802.1 prepilin peptidase [Macrococcus hajekii]GGB04028.1 type 4 prepilin-like proteins leader peptide-processing enzyme [Macrococcus hajekii]